MRTKPKIWQVDLDKCTGCRSCELACSFHNSRNFNPMGSSIHVNLDRSTGALSLTLDSTCDYCASEEEPLCILFCTAGALHLLGER